MKEWLEGKMSPSSVSSRLSNIRRLQNIFGSLQYLYKKDKLVDVRKILSDARTKYSSNQITEGILNFNRDFNYYNIFSTLIAAVELFLKFQEEKDPKISLESTLFLKGREIQEALDSFQFVETKEKYSKKEVRTLIQEPLKKHLKDRMSSWEWSLEVQNTNLPQEINNIKDRIDIYGFNKEDNLTCIIEIDTVRSDQIAKKFVSRLAVSLDSNLIYGIVLYPNNHKYFDSELKEADKYKKFVEMILNKLGTKEHPKTIVTKELFKREEK